MPSLALNRVKLGLALLGLLGGLCQAATAAEPNGISPALPDRWVDTFHWRCIGPANMGGRISALAVYEADSTCWWAATASGGLLKTINNGITFEHQFDREATVSIGDVAVAQSNRDIVWVGTGENNPRNSVSWGDGVYKSVDGGRTWQNMGLRESFQIGRIAIHPTNPDIVYIGALGRLWGPNEQRGLFKTTDGGRTWQNVLYIDDRTGVIDVAMHPTDPQTLIVATYERQRDGFDSNDPAKKFGPGSGLYKTTDGGATWYKLTRGLPTCHLGRIGIDYYRADPNIVYVVLESARIGHVPPNAAYAGFRGEDVEVGARLVEIVDDGPAAQAGLQTGDVVTRLDDVGINSYGDLLREVRRHAAGNTVSVEVSRERKSVPVELTFGKRSGREDERSPFDAGLGGQEANLQDQQGGEGYEYGGVYRSIDGGESWQRINSVNPRPMYFSQVRVDPRDNNYIWVLGMALHRSVDGGKTFTNDGAREAHVDHHAMWIDPQNGRHLILGNDGGVYVSYDRGDRWDYHNHMAIGQYYHVTVSPRRDYRVYGGLQDNGTWGGPSRSRSGPGPVNADWTLLGWGDGFVCCVDRDQPDLVYFESQNGWMGRYDYATAERGWIRPEGGRGNLYRFNWKTPYLLSHHNPRLFYVAANYVFRSLDRGEKLKRISPEITRTSEGSATALAESPLDEGLLYVGTDDGLLWVTRDGGHTWHKVTDFPTQTRAWSRVKDFAGKIWTQMAATATAPAETQPATEPVTQPTTRPMSQPTSAPATRPATPTSAPAGDEPRRLVDLLPGPRFISAVEPSRFEPGRVYLTLDAHRSNDDELYVFVSEDHGQTWRSLRANLPTAAGSTRVIREDLYNPDLLYLGTEFGAWVSIDRGGSWTRLRGNLPTVAVHEFAIHPTAGEIVIATHGRSLWALDVTALRQMTPDVVRQPAFLYEPNHAIYWREDLPRGAGTARYFYGENPPAGAQVYYSLTEKPDRIHLKITDLAGEVLCELPAPAEPGLHCVPWDLRRAPAEGERGPGPLVPAGPYRVELTVGDEVLTQTLEVETDPVYPDYRPWE
ncbi:MAG: PDZ domain-containing protein [Phycisphaerae bacterium]|jgi:photosystem II stability/assembly factor-like uncharacterized protein